MRLSQFDGAVNFMPFTKIERHAKVSPKCDKKKKKTEAKLIREVGVTGATEATGATGAEKHTQSASRYAPYKTSPRRVWAL